MEMLEAAACVRMRGITNRKCVKMRGTATYKYVEKPETAACVEIQVACMPLNRKWVGREWLESAKYGLS